MLKRKGPIRKPGPVRSGQRPLATNHLEHTEKVCFCQKEK